MNQLCSAIGRSLAWKSLFGMFKEKFRPLHDIDFAMEGEADLFQQACESDTCREDVEGGDNWETVMVRK